MGSHLVEALHNRLHHVRVLDDFSTGSAENLAKVAAAVEIVHGDVRDFDVVRRAMQGVDFVFHLAAPVEESHGLADPMHTHHGGATGTLHVLMAAREAEVRRVIYASSCCVYGEPTGAQRREDELPCPLSPYAVAKLTGEQHCVGFTGLYGLETVRLRYFNVYGPRKRPDSPYASKLTHVVSTMLAGQRPFVHGGTQEMLDLSYVDDVVHASLVAATAPRVAGKVYNIGAGRPVSTMELVGLLNDLLNTNIQPIGIMPSYDDKTNHLANIEKTEVELGFCPGTNLEKGLRLQVAYSQEALERIA